MALSKFKAPPLPNPPTDWDAQYMRQVIRTLELYFGQLDSKTPNYAESYTADNFYGRLVPQNVTTAEKVALTVDVGTLVFDTTLDKLCVKTAAGWQTVTSV
jgi:hypothetical protein